MDDSDLIAESVTRFALDLYRELGKVEGNLFFSPASIVIALAMTYAGAKGETGREMARTMRLPDLEPARLHAAFGFLLSNLSYECALPEIERSARRLFPRRQKRQDLDDKGIQIADDEDVVDSAACLVRMANAIWGQAGMEFLESYRHLLESFYESELHQADFSASPEQARKQINSWVAKKTRGKIPELLAPGILTEHTRLVLTNAVYFKAEWQNQFSENQTRQLPFFLMGGTTQSVSMMNKTDNFSYMEDEYVQVLELPYVGGQFAMLIILPKEKNGLETVESQMSFEQLDNWRKALSGLEVDLRLPKFEFRQHIELVDVLRDMGIYLAFDDTGDFSGMTGIEPLKEDDERLKPENWVQYPEEIPIVLSEAMHEAFIKLDENGTEAVAVSLLSKSLTFTGFHKKSKPIKFYADHPFVFAIIDTIKGAPLFIGRMKAPKP